ncbi:RecT-like DNA pairing protein [Arthrobacter phage Abba]|uniref:RecT-like DNA pairing protein n=1 Tax=Arthrobacter phage Abba TaxID=2713256 RepID=A0A6G8R2C4_9CAUD|nr:RecT-like ssDNA annealing protein [Arthrobacter phage Abba]QIN94365.1 RecT-like DNA pairing protein [Arthrobacter phage Abba]
MGHDLTQRAQGAVANQQAQPKGVEETLRDLAPQFQMAMPKGAEAMQLVRDAITVVRQTPRLLEVDKTSLLGSLMTCAQLGLRPGIGALGHAWIIPFKGQAQFILGYQGMIELANRAGEIEGLVARTVHERDVFDIDYGSDTLVHKPNMKGDRGDVIGYYAKFYRKGSNRPTFEFMTLSDMKAHRDQFAMAKNRQGQIIGPWRDHFDAMGLKTVVRKVMKWAPRSTQIQTALIADETVRLDYTPDADVAQVTKGVPFDQRGVEHAAVDDGPLDEPVDSDGVLGMPEGADETNWQE